MLGSSNIIVILKRLVTVIPTLIGVVIVTFLLTRVLPGDPGGLFRRSRRHPAIDRRNPQDRSASTGRCPSSLSAMSTISRTAISAIRCPPAARCDRDPSRLPASAELTLFGLILAIAIAVPLGILAAVKQGSWIDQLCRVIATAGVSLPVFFTGLLLVYVFYFQLGWSPAPIGRLDAFATAPREITGFYLIDSLITGDFETFRAAFSQLILPALTLGDLLAGADHAHDARLDAGGAGVRFRAHRARQRP